MRRDVEFRSGGETVRGWLYVPEGAAGPVPLVVMAGGWCYVKELVQPHYAERFEREGLAVLLFDYRNFGASGGARRQHIDPVAQIEDYKNAISYAETLPEVDAERIGVWGLSYSGGHVLIVAATDPRVKCVSSQIPVVDGYRNMRRVHGTLGFRRFEEAILADRRRRFAGEEEGYFPHAAPDPVAEVSSWPFPETYETFKELKAREAPAYENRSTIESAELLMSYSVWPFVPRILDTPTLVIVAERDDLTLWDLEIEVYNALPTAKKKLVTIGDSTHMTLYSDRSLLAQASEASTGWFAEQLL
ncbi:MAG TPA: alpha/beta hydrolase [Solirubrobacterales bacterium]|nr:alpha/beta hydrolase [Solirubrobacterales bacterium]